MAGPLQPHNGISAPGEHPFRPADGHSREQTGFTLVELIVIIAVLGILAAFTVPRLLGSGSFAERSAQDALISTARYAQQIAMTRGAGSTVQLVVTSSQYGITIDGNPALQPGSGSPYPLSFPDGVGATPAAIRFLSIGDAQLPAATRITLTGTEEQKSVCIERTGYAHAC
ncbi:MAG: GspH/FimT family pseudopilin [Pseudomonadota bacterium]